MTELAVIKLTRPDVATDIESLVSRMDRLERRLANPGPPAGAREPESPAPAPRQPVAEAPSESAPVQAEAAPRPAQTGPIDITFDKLKNVWQGLFSEIAQTLGSRRWALFREATPAAVEGNTIILEVNHDFHLAALEQDDVVSRIVETKASDLLGTEVKVKFRARQTAPAAVEEDPSTVDINQLEERPELETDAETLLASELGAKVVEE